MFLLALVKQHRKYPDFAIPKAKRIVNTVVLGFQGAKTLVFTVFFCAESFKKRENGTYLTIFGHYGTAKKLQGDQQQQQQQSKHGHSGKQQQPLGPCAKPHNSQTILPPKFPSQIAGQVQSSNPGFPHNF